MSNLSTFEIIAGTASIVGLLLAVGGYALSLRRKLRQRRESAEQELARELDRLQAAGRTVSARTDLGFFVLIELGSLRDSIAFYRHLRTVFLGFAIVLLLMATEFAPGTPREALAIFRVIASAAFLNMVLFGVVTILIKRLQEYTDSYERRIKEVWQRPIDKRVTPKDS